MSDEDNNKKNPWGDKPNGHEEGPPELGHFFKSIFGRRKRTGGSPSGQGGVALFPAKYVLLVIVILVIIWALSGIFVVQQPEQAVLLRFGKFESVVGPGAHWMPRFIDKKYVVNIDRIMSTTQQGLMLTSKENIVSVLFSVKYKISNPQAYLFNSTDPVGGLNQIIDSAIREVVGQSTLNAILTTGRTKVRNDVETQIKLLLNRYKLGLTIVDVDMQEAGAPDQVREAFDDVIKAREDQVTLTNQGKTYANKIIPLAKGQASHVMEKAKADKQQLILKAQGAVSRYLALLPQYKTAPAVTKERMYLSTMEGVLQGSRLVVMDSKGNNNLFYWPHMGGLPSPTASETSSPPSAQPPLQTAAASAGGSENVTTASLGPMRQSYLRWQEAQSNAN